MTLQEIFVLNNVLEEELSSAESYSMGVNASKVYAADEDVSEIYSLPPLSNLNMTQITAAAAKDLLIKRGLLKNHREFTDEGILVTKRLMHYKAAKKYIRFLNLSMGLLDYERAVMIEKKGDNDYGIVLIDIKNAASQFLEVFDFIKAGADSETLSERSLTPKELKKEYPNTYQNFRLKTKEETVITDELCFLSDSQLYIYDYETQILSPKSYEDTTRLFQERLVI